MKSSIRNPIAGLVAAIFLLPGLALAAPNVESVSGTIENRGSVTIQGAGFGTKTAAAPYRWDDFESGTLGQRLAGEGEGGWYTDAIQSGKWPVYNKDRARTPGSQSAYQNFTGGNYNSTIGLTDLPDSPIYLSGWFYLSTTGAPSRNVKLLQMRPGDLFDQCWECRIDQYPNNGSGHQYVTDCNGSTVLKNNWEIGDEMFTGGWHRLESWLDQGSRNGNDGLWTVWIDGQLWTQVSGTLMSSGDCPVRRLWLGFYFATDTGSPQPQAQRWWDELYVDFTRMRVEIGDAPTWNACTHRDRPDRRRGGQDQVRPSQLSFRDGNRRRHTRCDSRCRRDRYRPGQPAGQRLQVHL